MNSLQAANGGTPGVQGGGGIESGGEVIESTGVLSDALNKSITAPSGSQGISDCTDCFEILTNKRFEKILRDIGVDGYGKQFYLRKGWALEDAFLRAFGLSRNGRTFQPGNRKPDAVDNAFGLDINSSGTYPSIFYEVKAVKQLSLTKQLSEMIEAAANATKTRGTGNNENAGQMGVAEFVIVTFSEHLNTSNLPILEKCVAYGVHLSVVLPIWDKCAKKLYFTNISNIYKAPLADPRRWYIPVERTYRNFFNHPVKLDAAQINLRYMETNEDGSDGL